MAIKFIVSSKSMWVFLERSCVRKPYDDGEKVCQVQIEGNKLNLGSTLEIDVHSNKDGIFDMNKKKLNTLRKLLRALEDQPVTIVLEDHDIKIAPLCI